MNFEDYNYANFNSSVLVKDLVKEAAKEEAL
jgi:hypothetical protein